MAKTRELARRKHTPFFKPLSEIDFSKSERTTHSYVNMPIFYP